MSHPRAHWPPGRRNFEADSGPPHASSTVSCATMTEHMILCAGPMRTLQQPGLIPPFVSVGEITLDATPRRYTDGGDVVVYSQQGNSLFVYLGVLRRVSLDEPGRKVTFARYDAFPSPVVACDGYHGIDRPELRSPLNGFGPLDFNYIDASAFDAIMSASTNPVEPLLWQAVSAPAT